VIASRLRGFNAKASPNEIIMQRFDDALDALDWLLGSKVCCDAFQHVLNGGKAAHLMVRIQGIAKSDGSAAEMAAVW
jgi:hypothetical protein